MYAPTLYDGLERSMLPTWSQAPKKEFMIHAASCRQHELKHHKEEHLKFVFFIFQRLPDAQVKESYIADLRGF